MKLSAFAFSGAATVATVLCIAASSDGLPKPLNGVYAIGTTNVDPRPTDSRDSHFIVFLEGATAKDLYEAMKTEPRKDACAGPTQEVKTIGGTSCSFSPESKSYSCNLAIDIAKQKIERLPC